MDLSQCDCLVHASALTIIRLSDQDKTVDRICSKRAAWRSRLESQIQRLRCHLSQLLVIHHSVSLSVHLRHLKLHLFKKYCIKDYPSFLTTVESLKQRVIC